jgi:hypothetical protein
VRVRLLTELLRLLAPLRFFPAAHCRDDDEREDNEHADCDRDPDPSCHYRLLVRSEANGARFDSVPDGSRLQRFPRRV